MKMKVSRINEGRFEDELYFNGCFWIIADSYKDILEGNFSIDGLRYLVDVNGNEVEKTPKASKVHQRVWSSMNSKYPDKSWTYYPRGRVSIYDKKVYINLNSRINLPLVIQSIINYYGLDKFKQEDISINDIDVIQPGGHYDFDLK